MFGISALARTLTTKGSGIFIRSIATNGSEVANSFTKNLLSTVIDESHYDFYTTSVSANGESFIDGFFETINKDTDKLLVISNGMDGDVLAKRAYEKGVPVEWADHSFLFPLDSDEASQDLIYRQRITHALITHIDSFTGAITPIRSIIQKIRKIRKDITICVDNRTAYNLHPMPNMNEVIDYVVNETNILGVNPAFGFMVSHTPAIMSVAHRQKDTMFASLYNHNMHLEKMLPAIQQKYNDVMDKESWHATQYHYEDVKAHLMNKVKTLLPPIPFGLDQSCYASAFLVPQEAARLRELLEGLKEIHVPVSFRFISTSMPAISFKTSDLIQFEENGGDLMDIYKCIERISLRKMPMWLPGENFYKEERNYRRNHIFEDLADLSKGPMRG